MNNKTKKLAVLVLAALLAFSALTACGSSAETSAPAQEAASVAEPAAESVAEPAAASTDSVTVITVGTPGVYALQCFVNDAGELDGAEMDVIKAIDELLPQYEFQFETIEFASLFPALDAGKVDIACSNLRRNDDREAAYIHTYRAYITSPYNIIVLDNDTAINGIEDLEGKTIGINEGSMQATIFEQYIASTGANITLQYSTDPVPDLISGRVAAIIDPARYALSLNTSYEDAQFKVVGEAIDSLADPNSTAADNNAYLWFKTGDTELRDAISEALGQLYDNGTLGEISVKWYGEDYAALINKDIEAQLMTDYGISQ